MSLLRRLLLGISLALLGMGAGTLVVTSSAARHSLTQQLHMHSENAAAALALSLSQPANQAAAMQAQVISAWLDTGQFQRIALTDPGGHPIFVREQHSKANAQTVPAWFAALMPLPVAQAQRAVSDGGRQTGVLQVQSDNTAAQFSLWQSTLTIGGLLVLAGAVWAVCVLVLLRWFQRVLRENVAAQVRRIGAEQSPADQPDEPVTVAGWHELTGAVADAQTRVLLHQQAQMERIDALELETNRDLITQLPNRKYLVNALSQALQRREAPGHLLLIRLRDLQSMNACFPRHEVDEWLKNMGVQLQHLLQSKQVTDALLARLNGSDFALLLPGENSLYAVRLVQAVRALLQPTALVLKGGQRARWAYAFTAYAYGDTPAAILARLDQSLMLAESSGDGDVEYAELAPRALAVHATGEGHWQKLLADVLQHSTQLGMTVHKVTSSSMVETEVRYEAALQLLDDQGQALSAGLFLPAAVRLGLTAQFDEKAIALGVQWLQRHPRSTLVVRVSLPSLAQPAFVDTVRRALAKSAEAGLVLELDAHALEVAADRVLPWVYMVTGMGASVGLRRLEQAPRALVELTQLPLRYVKVGGYFAEQALHNLGIQHLLEAMLQTAQVQGTQVYVTDLVEPAAADWLRAKGVSLLIPAV